MPNFSEANRLYKTKNTQQYKLVASRYVKRENASLPVGVHRS